MEQQNYNTEVYSANFKTGTRTYFINLLEAKNKAKDVRITESRKVSDTEFEKNRILLFQNDLLKLTRVLNQAVSRIKNEGEKEQQLPLEGDAVTDVSVPENETQAEESVNSPQAVTPEHKEENSDFPNSGKKWTREDEEKLEFLYKAGKTVDDLTEIFGRKQKGIESRLEKLGLIES